MTKISHTHTAKFRKASRFSMLALALSLSAGTVAGMFGIAALTSGPVQAQSAGNGGGRGGEGAGAGSNPMAANPIAVVNHVDPNRDPNRGRDRQVGENCNGSAEMAETQKCRYNQRSTPRIVRINGFSNCAIIQQVPNPQGGQAEFFCVKPM